MGLIAAILAWCRKIYTAINTALNTQVPANPAAGSLADILSKGTGNTYNRTTDSLEAIRDKLDAGGDESVATANDSANTLMKQAVGNKADTAVSDVSTTKSLMSYIKWLVQESSYRAEPKCAAEERTSNSDTWSDVVNISDKGVLTGVSQHLVFRSDGNSGSLRITIDGTVVLNADGSPYFTKYASSGDPFRHSHSLAFNHRFNSSLRVEHRGGSEYTNLATFVTYTID